MYCNLAFFLKPLLYYVNLKNKIIYLFDFFNSNGYSLRMIAISFILSFIPVVFIHELGHFVAGLYLKAKPVQFTLGAGPAVVKKKYKGILYSLNLFPVGGYVIFNTTQFPDLEPDKEKLSPLRWILISLAGPLSNFLLTFLMFCFISFSILSSLEVYSVLSSNKDFQGGILIKNLKSKTIPDNLKTKYTHIFIEHDGALFNKDGLSISKNEFTKNTTLSKPKKLKKSEAAFLSIYRAGDVLILYFKATTLAFINLFKGTGELSGPLGIAQKAGETFNEGFTSFLLFIASLSFALGYFNLLPIMLLLDGGRAFAGIIEILIRKPITKQTLVKLFQISWIGIFILFFISLGNDLKNILSF